MDRETPNKDYLDSFIDHIRDQYQVEHLKDWELHELKREEWNIRLRFQKFQKQFPPEKSVIQGPYRAVMLDDPSDTKQSLTILEQERLDRVKKEVIGNVKRARGLRQDKRRSQWERLLAKLVEVFQWMAMAAAKIRGRF